MLIEEVAQRAIGTRRPHRGGFTAAITRRQGAVWEFVYSEVSRLTPQEQLDVIYAGQQTTCWRRHRYRYPRFDYELREHRLIAATLAVACYVFDNWDDFKPEPDPRIRY